MSELKILFRQIKEIQKTDKEISDYGKLRKLFNEKFKSIQSMTLKVKLECLGTTAALENQRFNRLSNVCEWLADIQKYIKMVLMSNERDYYKELSLIFINRLLSKGGYMGVDILF